MLSRSRIFLFLKGVAMGGADVVPGVSGGTIAFITGIYEELLETLSNLNLGLLKTWKEDGFKAFWKALNGSFLLTLFSGIFVSLVSLALVIEYLRTNHEVLLWSFFFGLIVASVWLMGKQVKWDFKAIVGLLLGTAVAFYITTIAPTNGGDSWWYILLSGSIAITAMILPGISGSFILLLMGMYSTVLGSLSGAVKSLGSGQWSELIENGKVIALFATGCLAGLIMFSKGLNWLFKNHRNITVAVLTGFLIGSLNKVYPWKEKLEPFVKHKGEANEETIYLVTNNVTPNAYIEISGEPHQLGAAILCALIGLGLIVLLERAGNMGKSN